MKSHINCPNIKKIREKYRSINKFVFRSLASDEVKKVIKDLKWNKSVCCKNFINYPTEETGIFHGSLKIENITPIFKKDDPLDKSNYRQV